MNKKFIGAILALFMATTCATSCGNKGDSTPTSTESIQESIPGGATGGVISVPTAKNFNLDNAIADKDHWLGVEKQNPVFDSNVRRLSYSVQERAFLRL